MSDQSIISGLMKNELKLSELTKEQLRKLPFWYFCEFVSPLQLEIIWSKLPESYRLNRDLKKITMSYSLQQI